MMRATTSVLDRTPAPPVDLLQRVALALDSTLDLKEVLRLLAGMALEASSAERCSLFLLRDERLVPAVAIGRDSDQDAWSLFRAMGPIPLDEMVGAHEFIKAGVAVHVPDAGECDLVPETWTERFDLKALVLVPLSAAGEPCGVMALDSAHGFTEHEVATLDALGSYAGVAVRNARTYAAADRRARYQKALAEGTAALVSTMSTEDVVERLADAYQSLLGADVCLIGLLDRARQRVTTLTSRGPTRIPPEIPLSDIPEDLVARITEAWRRDAGPFDLDDEIWLRRLAGTGGFDRYVMLPIVIEGEPAGAVLLAFRSALALDEDGTSAATALAAIAGSALQRSTLTRNVASKLRCLEILHGLGAALQAHSTNRGLVGALNRLLSDEDIHVDSLELTDPLLARHLDEPEKKRNARAEGSGFSIPMRVGKRTVGSLNLAAGGSADIGFLETLANGVAEVATRAAMRTDLEQATRERAVMGVREGMAADLHDTAGQIFVAIRLLARRHSESLPADSQWSTRIARFAELAEQGKWEIDQAVRALSFFPAARGGLVPAIASLVESFELDSGIRTLFDVEGEAKRLTPDVERALYRVSHEAVTNAWRHARASVVNVRMEFEPGQITLEIVDDGVGLSVRSNGNLAGVGVASMRKAMLDVGGDLRLKSAQPRGALVTATVPAAAAR